MYSKRCIFEWEKLDPKMLINQVIQELKSYKEQLFLFIFDNVLKDQMTLLHSFIANVSKNKVKVLITTRDSDLSNEEFHEIKLECFNPVETQDYVKKYLKRTVSPNQCEDILDLVKVNGQVLALKLQLTIANSNAKYLTKNWDELIDRLERESKASKYVNDYLLIDLAETKSGALQLLAYLAFFIPISLDFTC